MATVVPPMIQAQLAEKKDNAQKQRMQLLEAETELYIATRQELREQQSRERHFWHLSSKFYFEAKQISWKIKTLEDQRDAADLASTDLESKLSCSRMEILELAKQRDGKRKFHECEGAQVRGFTLQLQNHALNIHTQTTEARADADEVGDTVKCDSPRVRKLAATSSDVDNDTDVNESERSRLIVAKQAIGHDVRSNLEAVSILEQRLHEALRISAAKKRELAAAAETLKAEITVLQATESK